MISPEQYEWLHCKRCGNLFFVRVTLGANGNIIDDDQPDECPECREGEEDDHEI